MPGEDPSSQDPLEARHWIDVYGRMIRFKRRLLEEAQVAMSNLRPETRTAAEPDIALLDDQLQRYLARLDFWHRTHLRLEGIVIDQETRVVTHRAESVRLTAREHQLLQALLAHPGEYVSARRLIAEAWHDPGLSADEVRMYVGHLRRKLRQIGLASIPNRPGRGYTLRFEEA
jgi:hypothetical protein